MSSRPGTGSASSIKLVGRRSWLSNASGDTGTIRDERPRCRHGRCFDLALLVGANLVERRLGWRPRRP